MAPIVSSIAVNVMMEIPGKYLILGKILLIKTVRVVILIVEKDLLIVKDAIRDELLFYRE
jgi:hypothetical protein